MSRTRPAVRDGPGLTRTTLCSVTTAGCILAWETSQSFLTVLGRNHLIFYIIQSLSSFDGGGNTGNSNG